ncbi:DDE-type integrase/transposase/recombinase [Spirosoma arboris]|uniref:DDE-type integrase/transposase/recombinase n=1 Tax=Spirosoma arboris TaxID=2682092 RepID=UPI001D12C3D1|nr:DDE-type integrase/transposase/recombinase [Spirosoma arboris]
MLDQPLPKAPNLVWVSDITYLPLVNGEWGYLATWMDLFSRKVVGWQVGETMEDELVVLPLRRALQVRQPAVGLIIHRSGDPVRSGWPICIHGVKRVNPVVAY